MLLQNFDVFEILGADADVVLFTNLRVSSH